MKSDRPSDAGCQYRTVSEAVDGSPIRMFAATLGSVGSTIIGCPPGTLLILLMLHLT
jgi:hypothetical protein